MQRLYISVETRPQVSTIGILKRKSQFSATSVGIDLILYLIPNFSLAIFCEFHVAVFDAPIRLSIASFLFPILNTHLPTIHVPTIRNREPTYYQSIHCLLQCSLMVTHFTIIICKI